ncbi:peptidoglycan-binding protein [Vannielia litorea]|uniref:peptidoglycan-binding domain-containing protein n=1 Tax=Vannielia litorea TaxID=1217970 RepID=UPI001C9698E7|nr:peptidoglycan-binding domain-containing protein [Vannielia litorea]MBY6049797.1 peptidoglycan-binding protein [Vannielia litorea]MBY6077211.1 peptidoglycan-binding protein [Vannielia litorea]
MRSVILLTLAMIAGPATADRALILGQPEGGRGIFGASAPDLAAAYEGAGFTVIGGSPATAALMREGLARFLEGVEGERRLVIHLSGSFVRSGSDTWLLADDAKAPNLATVAGQGLALSTVLEIAAEVPGQSVVLIGSGAAPEDLGAGLSAGLGVLDIPQGVTVIRGRSAQVGAFAVGPLMQEGRSLAALAAAEDVTGEGFISAATIWRPEGETPEQPADDAPVADAAEVERAVWESAVDADSKEAYLGYLARYPLGQFADEARKAIAEIEAEPYRAERKAEEALDLSRDERRQIQRNLTVLDYRPRGIDGIFGPGTRGAIKAFQEKNGFPPSTYLTRQQIARLGEQAERRSAELEAEAERRRLEAERADRAYWEVTGAAGDEAGLRVYLKKYPDGIYSEIAQEQLSIIEEDKRREAAAQDRAAWDVAVNANTVASYRNYLVAYPKGAFAEEARAQIAKLTEEASPDRQEARAREEALRLPQFTKVLVERRLAQLGLEPGPTDGEFDQQTRRAIRRFQRDRELEVTGFLDEATVSRMLADAGIRIIRE